MTLFAHGIMSGMIMSKMTDDRKAIASSMVLGIAPDLVRLTQKNKNDWTDRYALAHDIGKFWWVPFWNLHILIDHFTHKPEGGWNEYGLPCEIIFWIIFGWSFYDQIFSMVVKLYSFVDGIILYGSSLLR